MPDLVRQRSQIGGRAEEVDVAVRVAVHACERAVDVVDAEASHCVERCACESPGGRAIAERAADRGHGVGVSGDVVESRVEADADVVLVVQQVRVREVVLRARVAPAIAIQTVTGAVSIARSLTVWTSPAAFVHVFTFGWNDIALSSEKTLTSEFTRRW